MVHSCGKKRLKREDSFFGIHFDFHAGKDCTEIGKNTTKEMIENVIREVKPDFIQCDCKGHPGFSSYPTRVGNAAPGIVKDALKIWREVTEQWGVGLYMHYSGVFDQEAVRLHPEWARVDERGEKDKDVTSTFGSYVDELLIPQLRELANDYGVDGAWLDGECWGARLDFCETAQNIFKDKTGLECMPIQGDAPGFYDLMELCRESFRQYLRHYLDELHKTNPGFQMASNWAFSSLMPEAVSADVDYLSGDFTMQNSVNSAKFEGRCLAGQGKPWELMAWSFTGKEGEPGFSTKSVVQLQREAATVISLGGGFQAYFQQKRDGSIYEWQMDLMKKVAQFCRERQEFCHKAESVPQVGLFYSGEDFYKKCPSLYGSWAPSVMKILEPIRGTLQALLDSQNVVDILLEHHIEKKISQYPLIVIPDCSYIKPHINDQLLQYVEKGGKLLLAGPECARIFEKELNIEFIGEIQENSVKWLEYNGWLARIKAPYHTIDCKDGVKVFSKIYHDNDKKGSFEPAATISSYGKGKIAALTFSFGEPYLYGTVSVARDFLSGLVRELFPDPIVEVTGSHNVDIAVNRIKEKLMVHLVNMAGPHADTNVHVFDEIPSIGPLNVAVCVEKEPKKVMLQPEGVVPVYQYIDGKVILQLPNLRIHEIIVIEE